MPVFIVDSNFFIQAHRAIYPLDVAKGFWNKVKQLAEKGIIVSIDKVRNELYDKNDDLEIWCRDNLPKSFFKDTSGIMAEYAKVSAWGLSMSHHYLPKALNEFLDADEADAFLVAYSLADVENRCIVTQELSSPLQRNKVKIPECCNALGVRYMTTIEMFRTISETF